MVLRVLKKGFTIVELVIVIAVIAILAAVLIPTFANLVDKANETVDMQLVKQMNTVLEAEEIVDGKPSTIIDAKKVLENNGIVQFKPVDSNNIFYWVSTKNIVLLYNNSKNKVIYPKEYVKEQKLETTWFDLNYTEDDVDIKPVITPNEGQSVSEALIEAINSGNAAKDIYVTLASNNNVNMNQSEFISFFNSINEGENGKKVHIDLNGNMLNINKPNKQGEINSNGILELSNGKISYEGIYGGNYNYDCLFTVKDGASLVLNNMEITATKAKALLFPAATASEIIISNTSIYADAVYVLSTNGSSSNKIRIQIDDSKIEGTGTCILVNVPSVTYINNSTIIGSEHALAVRSGDVTISDSVLKTTSQDPGIFSYKDFASNTSYAGGWWDQGNIFPAATIVAGDYSEIHNGKYPYEGNVTITLDNTQVNSSDDTKVPTILMASSDPNKKVMINYDINSNVGDIVVYGSNWTPAPNGGNEEVAIICHLNTLYVNGKQASLTEDNKTKIEN